MRNQRREQVDSLVFDSRFPHFLKQFLKPNPVAKGLPNAQQFRSRVLLLFLTASQVFKAVSHACISSCDCIHLLSRRGRSIPLFPNGAEAADFGLRQWHSIQASSLEQKFECTDSRWQIFPKLPGE